MPVETILVICNSAKERNCETPRPPPFSRPSAPILVFPKHTVIFFMHADTVFYSLYSAMEVCEVGIEVLDETQTITPLQQNPWLRVYQCNFIIHTPQDEMGVQHVLKPEATLITHIPRPLPKSKFIHSSFDHHNNSQRRPF